MVCASEMQFPTDYHSFKCYVCETINDSFPGPVASDEQRSVVVEEAPEAADALFLLCAEYLHSKAENAFERIKASVRDIFASIDTVVLFFVADHGAIDFGRVDRFYGEFCSSKSQTLANLFMTTLNELLCRPKRVALCKSDFVFFFVVLLVIVSYFVV